MDHGKPRAAHDHAGAALTSEDSNSSFALAVGFTQLSTLMGAAGGSADGAGAAARAVASART